MWGDWVFIATSCLDMFPAMCAPADISFYSIFQVAPNKMSKHNMSTCWNIHSGLKANIERELGPICSLFIVIERIWKKEIISTSLKQIVIELLTTRRFHHHHCHTINIWLICRFQFTREKDMAPNVLDVDRGEMTEKERLLNCKSPPIWGQVSLNSYTKCLVYNWVPKSLTSENINLGLG